jgi:hypothetical protein
MGEVACLNLAAEVSELQEDTMKSESVERKKEEAEARENADDVDDSTGATTIVAGPTFWYRNFRSAVYVSTMGSLVWTFLIVLTFSPFSYLPPIIAGGGAGTWFLIGYLLFLVIGLGGFGSLSSLLHTIEVGESRRVSRRVMLVGFILVTLGVTLSSVLLAIGGATGGYALTIEGESQTVAQNLLSPFVYPITATTLVALVGATFTLLAMARARVAERC